MSTLHAPFPYFGGKRRIAPVIWERLGHVPNYVEPFAGGAAALLARPMPPKGGWGVETINDTDGHLVNFWRAVQREPGRLAALLDYPVLETDLHARHAALVAARGALTERLLADPRVCHVELAAWWCWGLCMWIGGGWCEQRTANSEQRTAAPPDSCPACPTTASVDYARLAGIAGGPSHLSWRRVRGKSAGIHAGTRGRGDAGTRGRGDGEWGETPERGAWGAAGHAVAVAGHARVGVSGGAGVGEEREKSRWESHADGLSAWMHALAERLRFVRVCCGDFRRVLTPAVTVGLGTTGVFLDPPYCHALRDGGLYATEDASASAKAREWAIAHGDDPRYRICLAGYEGEHAMPGSWEVVHWKAQGGYANLSKGDAEEKNANARKERLWFSPHCEKVGLFG